MFTERSTLDGSGGFEGASERELVGVLEVAADREPAGQPRDLDPEGLELAGEEHRGRLALEVGVRAEDDLLDRLLAEAGEQLLDAQLLGPDALDRVQRALED